MAEEHINEQLKHISPSLALVFNKTPIFSSQIGQIFAIILTSQIKTIKSAPTEVNAQKRKLRCCHTNLKIAIG